MKEWYKWCQEVVVGGVKGKKPILWFMPWHEGGLGLVIMMLFQDPLHALDLGIACNINANVLMHMVESDMIDGPRTTTNKNSTWKSSWTRSGERSKACTRRTMSGTKLAT
jgi:hypothetical protein